MPLTPEALDAWLPQTQCTRCGYPRCRDYAEAIAAGGADFNQCPPGGDVTIAALARLLGSTPKPLNPAFGPCTPRQLAVIDEPACIGCRKCLDVCPVDAILGARKRMHTVLDAECNGCALCLPACPVDCIALVSVENPARTDSPWPEYTRAEVEHWRLRTEARLARLRKKLKAPRAARSATAPATGERARMRAEIQAAVARVRAKKSARPKSSA
ncbi:MAG TPA: RnfABCDGE type electron transport complex subunit B [Acidiferrobacterales bacterium]|nr:RnfABCDGE type electron transport complex subunit B [Acidiferrobacterales bacterium]